MRKKYKIVLVLIIVIIVILLAIFIGSKFLIKDTVEENPIKVMDSIDEYGYTLDERDTKLMKDTYNELKIILNSDEVDMESYAEALSKLFIIDLFTMNNKRSKFDVGGSEYIYTANVDNYKLNVQDTIYKNIETNVDGKRTQDLPEVSSVTVGEIEDTTFTIGEDNELNAYVVNISWDYVSTLGYDDEARLTLVVDNNKLFIVEYTTGE